MALNESPLAALIEKDAAKRFIQSFAISTSAAVTALGTTTADDLQLTVPVGAMLCLQSDQPFHYSFRTSTGATTAVTNYTGSKPGTYVAANQQEFVNVGPKDVALDVVVASGGSSGHLVVSLVRQS